MGSSKDVFDSVAARSRRGFFIGCFQWLVAMTATRLGWGGARAFRFTLVPPGVVGPSEDPVAALMARLEANTRPTDRPFYWGADPAEDPTVLRYRERMRQADRFERWSRSTPIPTSEDVSTRVGADLDQAISQAPQIATPLKERFLEGAFRALDMNTSDFKRLQRSHWRHVTRRTAADRVTAEELERRLAMLRRTAAAEGVAEEPGDDGITFFEAMTDLLTGEPMTPPDETEGAGAWWLAAIAVVAGVITYLGSMGMESLEKGKSGRIDKAREFKNDLDRQKGKDPDRTKRRSDQSERMQRDSAIKKGLGERQSHLHEEAVVDGIMDRTLRITARRHNAPPIQDDPEEKRNILLRSAAALRRSLDRAETKPSTTMEATVTDSLFDVIMQGSLEDIALYEVGITENADKLRQASAEAKDQRVDRLVSGFAEGAIHNPLDDPDALWE